MARDEAYISVDVEADGPIPGPYSMLSMGMSVVGHPQETWYAEFRPISEQFDPRALEVSGLDRERLKREGQDPKTALEDAERWLKNIESVHKVRCVFLAAPAVWDGMYVHWYFIRFLGRNPFGVTGSGIDLRSYWMGARDIAWSESGKRNIAEVTHLTKPPHSHRADEDAREQAAYFKAVLDYQDRRSFEANRLRDEIMVLRSGHRQASTLLASRDKQITKYRNRVFVGVAVIVRRIVKGTEQVLLGKRKGSHGAGTWCFPGGGQEKHETSQECAVRELHEETGIILPKEQLRFAQQVESYHPDANSRWLTLLYETNVREGVEPELKEPTKCEEWKWFPVDDLPSPLFEPVEILRRRQGTI